MCCNDRVKDVGGNSIRISELSRGAATRGRKEVAGGDDCSDNFRRLGCPDGAS